MLAATGCARLPPGRTDAVALPPASRSGQVYLIRGFLDWYSDGMDRLAAELAADGVADAVYQEEQWGDLGDALLARPNLSGPLVLIGFSYGADDVVIIARQFAEQGRTIDLLVTIDPVTPDDVPANVRRCVNFYEPNGVWDVLPFLRGIPLRAEPGGVEPENVNVRGRADLAEPDTSHATIADNAKVHRAIVDLVRGTCRPAPGLAAGGGPARPRIQPRT